MEPNSIPDQEGMARFMGPGAVDNAVREAIRLCWVMLPEDKKNVEELSKEIRRIVDRALDDLEEDKNAFHLG